MLQACKKNVKTSCKYGYLFLWLLFLSTLPHRLCRELPLVNTLWKKYSMGEMETLILKILHAKMNTLRSEKIAKAAVLNNL